MDYARNSSPMLRLPRGTLQGLAGWLIFGVVAVSLRGIRWDEDYEFAQVIARTIPYPEGHPLFVFIRNIFNIQVYGAAAIHVMLPNADLLCAIRNILFIAATVVPAYLLGTLMSGRALCGHVAAVFLLLGTHLDFDSDYPLQTWGHFFSNGHVGMGYALMAACFVAWRRYPLGYFLVGFMPCVHVGQMPALLGLAGARALVAVHERRWRDLAAGAAGMAMGIAACGLFALGTWPFHVAAPASGAYAGQGDPQQLWSAFVAADVHRAAPGGGVLYTNANLALLLFLLFALAASHVERYRRDFQPWRWMFVYGGCATIAVWGTMALHMILGTRMPYALLAWMPYRMSNHVVILLAAGLPAIVAATDPLRGGRVGAGLLIMMGTLIAAVASPLAHPFMPEAFYTRYVATGEGLFFFLCGAAATLLHAALRDDKPFRVRWTVAALGALIVVAMHHHFGAACIVAGVVARVGIDRFLRHTPHWHERLQLTAVRGTALAALAAVVLATLLVQQWREQMWLPRTPFDRNVAVYLLRRGDPEALIATRPDQYMMQARLGHPVMVDLALPTWPPYLPSIGPSVEKLYREIYGIHFGGDAPPFNNWSAAWRARRKEEWMLLAKAYGFRYVLSPNQVAVQLPAVLIGETESLYAVPGTDAP